jgi:hypothetical protein
MRNKFTRRVLGSLPESLLSVRERFLDGKEGLIRQRANRWKEPFLDRRRLKTGHLLPI